MRVLLVSDDSLLEKNIAGLGMLVYRVLTPRQVRIGCECFVPEAVVVDFDIGEAEALRISKRIRDIPDSKDTILFWVLPHPLAVGSCMGRAIARLRVSEFFVSAAGKAVLPDRLRALLEARCEV